MREPKRPKNPREKKNSVITTKVTMYILSTLVDITEKLMILKTGKERDMTINHSKI